jgi:hypothetical protein|tara:strand:+ start:41 stop:421 length:381 start_codon:yes stop_codon:yes gene_type:complete
MNKDFPPGFNENQIAIDFDGVIHKNSKGYHDGTIYDEPVEGSLEAIKKLSKKHDIVIFTCKAKRDRPDVNGKTGVMLVGEWLEKHGIRDCVKRITSEKPRAQLYIDDRGYHFENWNDTIKYVEELL